MIYHLKNDNYFTFETFEKNKLAPRAYFIPFSQKEDALKFGVTEARYRSDIVTCLSGEWDFCFFKDPKTLGKTFDTEKARFEKMTVPSCWEFSGYLDPMYLCTYLPFRFDPPKIPKERQIGLFTLAKNNLATYYAGGQYNSVGVYRKKFFVSDVNKSFIISFLGVSACLDLYVNGEFVGYSEGSHNTAEFRLDEQVKPGENEIVAVVRRFCNGSYLETQDMFRNHGIFRDVLLFVTEKKHISDYGVTAAKEEDGYKLTASVRVENGEEGDEVEIEFLGKVYKVPCNENGMAELSIHGIKAEEWSAEIPNLYTLTISFGREYVCEEVGLRHIEIVDDVFLFNGRKLKLKGVNHHDTDPEKGWTMSMEDMERDVRLMKEFNVNAVRTSHYPPDPAFVRLCKKYGLYVVEEADIETHCTHASKNICYISRDLKWADHYLDRVKRMYDRDKNLCNVIMWSLGNESGGIACQKVCYDYLKTRTDTPVHYEWIDHSDEVGFDVISEMYTPLTEMKEKTARRTAGGKKTKPYFLCEYAHAMGVGPGALEEYVDLFMSKDTYLGGCIWEWADHSVYHKDTGNFTYGGDHNDYINDKTFCIDGLFRPDRQPYTSAYSMKTAYRPIRAKHLGGGKVEFLNTDRFLSSDRLKVTVKKVVFGAEGEEKELPLVIPPMEKAVANFDYEEGTDTFLRVTYTDKASGKTVAKEQVTLSEHIPGIELPPAGKVAVKKERRLITVSYEGGEIVFDCKKAGFRSYKIGNKQIIAVDPGKEKIVGVREQLFRAPICNEIRVRRKWRALGLYRYKIGRVKSEMIAGEERVVIKFRYGIRGAVPLGAVEDVYTVSGDGSIFVETTFKPHVKMSIPRVGKTFVLAPEFDRARYYGRGEKENYPDMKSHAMTGVFESEGNFGVKMIVPQNSGVRCDVRWAEITDKEGTGVRFIADEKPFCLNLNHYDERTLAKWKHIIDYRDEKATYVSVDGFVRGVGSNSCGPLPEKEYLIPEKETLRYSFMMAPISPAEK